MMMFNTRGGEGLEDRNEIIADVIAFLRVTVMVQVIRTSTIESRACLLQSHGL